MSSISLKAVLEECKSALPFTTGKKGPLGEIQVSRIMKLAFEAEAHGTRVDPLGSGFIIPPIIKKHVRDAKTAFERVYPLCERIVELAKREKERKELDSYSKTFIGMAGVALLVPIDSRADVATSRPAIYAMVVTVSACVFQVLKRWQLPNRDAERAELQRLWIQVDGRVPADIHKASMQMRVQMFVAKAMVEYVSKRLRIAVAH